MKKNSAASWAKETLAVLNAAGDERVAAQARKYFKLHERVQVIGIKSAKIDEIEKEIFAAVKPTWLLADAVQFCDILIRNRFLEAKSVGIVLLSRYHKQYDKSLLETIHGWLADGHCGNWAATDVLSGRVLSPLLKRFPELLQKVASWTQSANLWVRRAAAVSLIPLARRGEHLDAAYAAAESLLGDSEDLMHKAVGWLLRECGKTDDSRLEAFLLAHGARIPRTALRYAIERFPEPRRKRLLVATKSAS
jgi:3-methyladenine DNA glycosylase AlkD